MPDPKKITFPISRSTESAKAQPETVFVNDDKEYPIRDIFRECRQFVLDDPSVCLSEEQRKALYNIGNCKTGECGYTVEVCNDCNTTYIHNASCGNRACPNCQQIDAAIWAEKRRAEVIAGIIYFHIVLTVPSQLYPLFLANDKALYGLLLRAANEAIVSLCMKDEYGGFKPPVFGSLHTWKSNLGYHPHFHAMVGGGGLNRLNQFAVAKHSSYLFPEKVLGIVFRSIFLDGLKKLHAQSLKDPSVLKIPSIESMGGIDLNDPVQWNNFISELYEMKWVTYLKETLNDKGDAIAYIARYVNRTAISNARIVNFQINEQYPEGRVVFKYKEYTGSGYEMKERVVTGKEFILLFLQHILPKGFVRVRYGGLLANSVKAKNLHRISVLLNTPFHLAEIRSKTRAQFIFAILNKDPKECPRCHGRLTCLGKVKSDAFHFDPGERGVRAS